MPDSDEGRRDAEEDGKRLAKASSDAQEQQHPASSSVGRPRSGEKSDATADREEKKDSLSSTRAEKAQQTRRDPSSPLPDHVLMPPPPRLPTPLLKKRKLATKQTSSRQTDSAETLADHKSLSPPARNPINRSPSSSSSLSSSSSSLSSFSSSLSSSSSCSPRLRLITEASSSSPERGASESVHASEKADTGQGATSAVEDLFSSFMSEIAELESQNADCTEDGRGVATEATSPSEGSGEPSVRSSSLSDAPAVSPRSSCLSSSSSSSLSSSRSSSSPVCRQVVDSQTQRPSSLSVETGEGTSRVRASSRMEQPEERGGRDSGDRTLLPAEYDDDEEDSGASSAQSRTGRDTELLFSAEGETQERCSLDDEKGKTDPAKTGNQQPSAPVLRIISRTKRTVAEDAKPQAGPAGDAGDPSHSRVHALRGSDGREVRSGRSRVREQFVPTPTEKLKTPEEKVAEFLKQIAFIQRAVDEHEERERTRRRRLRWTYTAASAGSEEEFFSDEDAASAAESGDSLEEGEGRGRDAEGRSASHSVSTESEDRARRERGERRERERAAESRHGIEEGDDLLEEIVEAELEAERRRESRGETGTEHSKRSQAASTGDSFVSAGICKCLCTFCKYCKEKHPKTPKKKGSTHETKQIEALLWTVAAELSKLASPAEALWRRRTEAALETRRFDWQAGALDSAYFLGTLRTLREDLKARVEQEERREKLQSNSSELASAFPYSSAAATEKDEKSSSSSSSTKASSSSASSPLSKSQTSRAADSPPSSGPVSAFSCIRSVYDPKRTGFSPRLPSSLSSSSSSSLASSSSSSLSASRSVCASYKSDEEAPLPPSPPPPMPSSDEDESSEAESREQKDTEREKKGDKEGEKKGEERGEKEGEERAEKEGEKGVAGASDQRARAPHASGEPRGADAASVALKEDAKTQAPLLSEASGALRARDHAQTAAGEKKGRAHAVGVSLASTTNPVLRKKMKLVDKWRRTREREDEEEERLERERERRELEREQRERQKIEEWKERQIASGAATRNANLIEVTQDWRTMIDKNRQQQL
ncbi:hypothetical protein TGVEG_321540 [Toxoplasma gondii VEG]|uniref:Uncharacterized protein n=1 Tax=Toxoplasma gondii (strain ATCC 50861 / VEG) TaxID=432359 RepID=V5B135_TOXGV|nr:hypothetical protein TGVEG_321540 [Toxoplasma gondii VEG]CEL71816.1 TPA: hypothetical protein BN1205_058990 [Toxoplasma gondii VEG]